MPARSPTRPLPPRPSENRAVLRIATSCNNACIFCALRGAPPAVEPTPEDIERALLALRVEAEELTFVGGEPSLSPILAPAITRARMVGFRRVGIQTNGLLLAQPNAALALAQAGLTDVHLSIHGADPAVHDYHTGHVGSFLRALAALSNAAAARLTVAVTTVVTRSSYRVLGELPGLLQPRGATAWCLAFPRALGAAAEAYERVMPRVGQAIPFVQQAVDTARRLGMPTWIANAPICALGLYGVLSLPTPPMSFAPMCDGCAERTTCPGLDAVYLFRHGVGELALLPVPAPRDETFPELRRLFVGTVEDIPDPTSPTGPVPLRRPTGPVPSR